MDYRRSPNTEPHEHHHWESEYPRQTPESSPMTRTWECHGVTAPLPATPRVVRSHVVSNTALIFGAEASPDHKSRVVVPLNTPDDVVQQIEDLLEEHDRVSEGMARVNALIALLGQ